MPRLINEIDFDREVLQKPELVIVDFFATWCAPCKMIAPILDELQEEFEGKVDIVKIDTDQAKEIARTYGVRGLPTLIFFKEGDIVDKVTGVQPKAALHEKISAWV